MSAGAPCPAVCVIGGGFSGSMCAAHLLRGAGVAGQRLDVHLVERRGAFCAGAAFGTRDPSHVLNVRSSAMSAIASEPDHFVRWLQSRGDGADPSGFAPRMLYAEYLRHTLECAESAVAGQATLVRHGEEAVSVTRAANGLWRIQLASGDAIEAGAVVLASGHQVPSDPLRGRWDGARDRWIGDPWAPHALERIGRDEPVAVIGSGLTATDAILSITGADVTRRSAPIWIVSRHGWFPQPHLKAPHQPLQVAADADRLLAMRPLRARTAIGWFRGLLDDAAHREPAADWRAVVDGIRPHTARIWRALDVRARSQFIRHARPIWEVHRHRMAMHVAAHVGAAVEGGQVRVIAGRPAHAAARSGIVELHVARSHAAESAEQESLRVAWVVNCTGPGTMHASAADPALASLLRDGEVRVDPLQLGIETDPQGRAIDARGCIRGSLLAIGTLRRPDCWESTAVPELRAQAAEVAALALESLGLGLRGAPGLRMAP